MNSQSGRDVRAVLHRHTHRRVHRRIDHAVGIGLILALLGACGGGTGSSMDAPASPASPAPAAPTPAPAPPGAASFTLAVEPVDPQIPAGSRRNVYVSIDPGADFSEEVTVTLETTPTDTGGDSLLLTRERRTGTLSLSLGRAAVGEQQIDAVARSATQTRTVPLRFSIVAAVAGAGASSTERIAGALAAGTIDLGTSLLYRAYAQVGDDRLPAAYRGAPARRGDLGLGFEIEAALPTVSADIVAALQPYIVRPDHPDSVYARPPAAASKTAASKAAAAAGTKQPLAYPPDNNCESGGQWRSVRSLDRPIRVWSECYANADADAASLANERFAVALIEKIWGPMVAMMGRAPRSDGGGPQEGGDDAIDVYIVNRFALQRGGEAISRAAVGDNLAFARTARYVINDSGRFASSGYLVIPADGLASQIGRSTIIHEFFHILQFAHTAELIRLYKHWFYEASATWAEVYFDRNLSWPRRVAGTEVLQPSFWGYLDTPSALVSDTPELNPYYAFMWPFFMEQRTGSADIIATAWRQFEAAKSDVEADVLLDNLFPFNTEFRRFAVRNQNESFLPGDPLPASQRYTALDSQFPGAQETDYRPPLLSRQLAPDVPDSVDLTTIAALDTKYVAVAADAAGKVLKVEFDFSGIVSGRQAQVRNVDAMIRTTAGWVSVPVPLDEDKVTFCFEKGPSTETLRGSFQQIRLVISNTDATYYRNGKEATNLTGALKINPSSKPCVEYSGTVNGTQTLTPLGGGTFKLDTSADVSFENDPKNSNQNALSFVFKAGHLSYRSEYTGPDCRTLTTGSITLVPQPIGQLPIEGGTVGGVGVFPNGDPFNPPTPPRPQHGPTILGLTTGTLTSVSNCNDSKVDITTDFPNSSIAWWAPLGQGYDVAPDGTLQGSGTGVLPGGAVTYTWNLRKLN